MQIEKHLPSMDSTSAHSFHRAGSTECTVHVVDDDNAVLESLKALLLENGSTVICYSSAEEFLAACPIARPCCLILDERLSGMSGSSLLGVLKLRGFDAPAILLSAFADAPLAVAALKKGAINVLQKPVKIDVLLQTLSEAQIEEEKRQKEHEKRSRMQSLFKKLSQGEREVMNKIVAGHPNKVIASQLGLSVRTVELRRHNIFEKLEVAGVAELVKLSMDYGNC